MIAGPDPGALGGSAGIHGLHDERADAGVLLEMKADARGDLIERDVTPLLVGIDHTRVRIETAQQSATGDPLRIPRRRRADRRLQVRALENAREVTLGGGALQTLFQVGRDTQVRLVVQPRERWVQQLGQWDHPEVVFVDLLGHGEKLRGELLRLRRQRWRSSGHRSGDTGAEDEQREQKRGATHGGTSRRGQPTLYSKGRRRPREEQTRSRSSACGPNSSRAKALPVRPWRDFCPSGR